MHEEQDVFTITLIVDGENSKLLLSTSDIPAKEDNEASGILYKEDLLEQYNEIISKIPVFKDAEEGSEESITHSVEEFLNLYDLDLVNVIEQGDNVLNPHPVKNVVLLTEYNPFSDTDSSDLSNIDQYYDPREALDNF